MLAQVAACAEAEVDLAVRSARQAFEAGVWSQRTPAERKQVLLRLAELILANRDELALLDSLNMGKPVMDAWNIDVPGAAGVFLLPCPGIRDQPKTSLRHGDASGGKKTIGAELGFVEIGRCLVFPFASRMFGEHGEGHAQQFHVPLGAHP